MLRCIAEVVVVLVTAFARRPLVPAVGTGKIVGTGDPAEANGDLYGLVRGLLGGTARETLLPTTGSDATRLQSVSARPITLEI